MINYDFQIPDERGKNVIDNHCRLWIVWWPVFGGGLDFEYACSPANLTPTVSETYPMTPGQGQSWVLPDTKTLFPLSWHGERAYSKSKAPTETGNQTITGDSFLLGRT